MFIPDWQPFTSLQFCQANISTFDLHLVFFSLTLLILVGFVLDTEKTLTHSVPQMVPQGPSKMIGVFEVRLMKRWSKMSPQEIGSMGMATSGGSLYSL